MRRQIAAAVFFLSIHVLNGENVSESDKPKASANVDETTNSIHPLFLDRDPRGAPDAGSLFVWDNIVDEIVDTVFNQTLAEMIGDYHHPELCSRSEWQKETDRVMKKLLDTWRLIAEDQEIPYMLAFGSLLGYARNKDVTPYDEDIDIFVPSWAYRRLIPLSVTPPLPPVGPEDVILFLHPEFGHVPPQLRRRYSCAGKIVDKQVDSCSFISPMGRLLLNNRNLNILVLDHLIDQKLAIMVGEGVKASNDLSSFFPLRRCTFVGIKMLCPNDYGKLLRLKYGPTVVGLLPKRLCLDGAWQSQADNPEAFDQVLAEWETRFADRLDQEEAYAFEPLPSMRLRDFCAEVTPAIPVRKFGYCNWPNKS